MYDFAYAKPTTLADAIKLLAEPDAKALAGGQTFIPVLKQRLNNPPTVVDLASLGLDGITREGGELVIGGMARHVDVATSPDVNAAIPALARLAGMIGDRQVRNRGTIGGSLANNDPSACYPAAVVALGASIVTDRRRIAADDFFQGMFTTALATDEIITHVRFVAPQRANYEKFRNPASRYAIVGVFVAQGPAGTRVAITGAGQGGVFRHAGMEAALARDFTADALRGVETPAESLIDDMHASAEYRAHLIGVMARRAVAGC
jgi:carbon-monoxide dehydrogenase medium subunit